MNSIVKRHSWRYNLPKKKRGLRPRPLPQLDQRADAHLTHAPAHARIGLASLALRPPKKISTEPTADSFKTKCHGAINNFNLFLVIYLVLLFTRCNNVVHRKVNEISVTYLPFFLLPYPYLPMDNGLGNVIVYILSIILVLRLFSGLRK